MTQFGKMKVLIFGSLVMMAMGSIAESPSQPAQDYRKGFEQFAKLGVPDLSKATYVKIDTDHHQCFSRYLVPQICDSSGNAWMLSETRDASNKPVRATFLINGGDVVTFNWKRNIRRRDIPKSRQDVVSPQAPVLEATWGKANLKRDVTGAFRFLADLSHEKDLEIKFDQEVQGRLFFLAFTLYQRGDVTNSMALVDELIKRSGSSEKVMINALNVVADSQYEMVYRKFGGSYDWFAYRDGIKELLARYPLGWNKAPAMKLLFKRVEERVANPVHTPSYTNGMTGADLAVAERMLGVREPISSARWVLWLVPTTWRDKVVKGNEVESEIRARGIEAIPFLLALTRDGTLMDMDRGKVELALGEAGLVQDNGVGISRETLAMFNNLRRPATRGEVAGQWLKEMLPDKLGSEEEVDNPGRLLSEALLFYKSYRKASDEELALQCISDSSGDLGPAASDFLLDLAGKRRMPLLENHLLGISGGELAIECESGSLERKLDLLGRYAFIRGPGSKVILDTMITNLTKASECYMKPYTMKFQDERAEADYIKTVKENLQDMGGELAGDAKGVESLQQDQKTEALIAAVAEAKDLQQGRMWAYLQGRMKALTFAESLGVLLKQAAATSSLSCRRMCLNMLYEIVTDKGVAGMGVEPTDYPAQWNALIADVNETCSNEEGNDVADEFLVMNEALFSMEDVGMEGGNNNGWWDKMIWLDKFIERYGRRGREFVRERVTARLKGVAEPQLPHYPLTEPGNPKVYSAMKTRLEGVNTLGKAQVAEGRLSIHERVALPGFLGRDLELNKRLTLLANTITKVTLEGVDGALRTRLMAWRGKPFAPELVGELRDYCYAQTQAGRSVRCCLQRKESFGGAELFLEVKEGALPSPDDAGGSNTPPWEIKGLIGLVCGPGLYAEAGWRTVAPTRWERSDDVMNSEPDDMDHFGAGVELLCGSKVAASEEAFVMFGTKQEYLGENRPVGKSKVSDYSIDPGLLQRIPSQRVAAPVKQVPVPSIPGPDKGKARQETKQATAIVAPFLEETMRYDGLGSFKGGEKPSLLTVEPPARPSEDDTIEFIKTELESAGLHLKEDVEMDDVEAPEEGGVERTRPKLESRRFSFDLADVDRSIYVEFLSARDYKVWDGGRMRSRRGYDFPALAQEVADSFGKRKTDKRIVFGVFFDPVAHVRRFRGDDVSWLTPKQKTLASEEGFNAYEVAMFGLNEKSRAKLRKQVQHFIAFLKQEGLVGNMTGKTATSNNQR